MNLKVPDRQIDRKKDYRVTMEVEVETPYIKQVVLNQGLEVRMA